MSVITGKENINMARLISMKYALRLEAKGMKRRGPSVASVVKAEFGWKGNAGKLAEQMETYIKDLTKGA